MIGDVTAVVTLDKSAVFDMVNRDIFLEKFSVVNWVHSYLMVRKQKVYIDGCLSEELGIQTGVPQGSILGPLFYIIYTSDLPQSIYTDNIVQSDNNQNIKENGTITCFADDSTYSVSDNNPETITNKINTKYQEISRYMQNNLLVLNSDKTHLVVMASAHKHRKYDSFGIELNTGNEIIQPAESEILLGATLSNNFQWNQHVQDGEKSMMKSLNKRNTALGRISNITNFKTRKMIGNGLIMSTLAYIIPVYGSCSEYLLNSLQVQQNIACRHITKLPLMTPTKTLLTQCGWLSVI